MFNAMRWICIFFRLGSHRYTEAVGFDGRFTDLRKVSAYIYMSPEIRRATKAVTYTAAGSLILLLAENCTRPSKSSIDATCCMAKNGFMQLF